RPRRGGPWLGGHAKPAGLYAAGLAARHGAQVVNYLHRDPARQAIAAELGARTPSAPEGRYDVVLEATSRAAGLRRALRALAPGGVCTAVGYYLMTGTRVPLLRMYATEATLGVGV